MTAPTPAPPASVADRLRRRPRTPWIVGGSVVAAVALAVGGIAAWNAAAPQPVAGIVIEEFDEAPEIGTWALPLGAGTVGPDDVCEAGQDAALLIVHDQLGRPSAVRLLDTATGESPWETPLPAGIDTATCAAASVELGAAVIATVDAERHPGVIGVELEEGALTIAEGPIEALTGLDGRRGGADLVVVATEDAVQRLDPLTLEPVWSLPATGASVAAGDGVVLVGDRVVRAEDGTEVGWTPGEGSWGSVDGVLLRVDADGPDATVHAVDPGSGRDRWSREIGPASAIPIAGSGLLLVTGDGVDGIEAVRLADGGTAWRLDAALGAEPAVLQGDGRAGIALLPVTGDATTVDVVDLATGEPRFALTIGDPAAPSRVVALTEETITLAEAGGRLVAVEAVDGEVRWRLGPDERGGPIVEVGGRFLQLAPGTVLGIGAPTS